MQQQQARRGEDHARGGSSKVRGRGGGRERVPSSGQHNNFEHGYFQGNNNASQQHFYGRQQIIPYHFNNFGMRYDRFPFHPNFPFNLPVPPQRERQRELSLGKEVDLETKLLRIARKRFYVDVKENNRGKFIKIAEVGPNNQKSRVLMTLSVSAELRDKLGDLIKIYSALPEHDTSKHQQIAAEASKSGQTGGVRYPEQRIKSETIVRENRRYYLDLKENQRGRFLRVTMMSNTQRAMIAIPAEGLEDVRAVLADYITRFASEKELENNANPDLVGTAAGSMPGAQLESSTLRVNRGVVYYFDVGTDRRGGTYLRVSDVRSSYRTAITIPVQSWAKFSDTLHAYVDKLDCLEKNDEKSTTEIENQQQIAQNKRQRPSSGSTSKPTNSPRQQAANSSDDKKQSENKVANNNASSGKQVVAEINAITVEE